jgi:dolichol-phosphate mannosyltransferase
MGGLRRRRLDPQKRSGTLSLICFVAPLYNEAENLTAFLDEWLPVVRTHGRMLVVNDGSKDGSAELLDQAAARHPEIHAIHQPNGGHGSAILTGYRAALQTGAEWVFQVDSDRQFVAADFERLWQQRERAGLVLGYRAERHDHPVRLFLSGVHRQILSAAIGVRLRDPNCPYRLMKASLLRRLLSEIPPAAFAPNVFLAAAAARSGVRVVETSVEHRERPAGTASIRGWKTLRIGMRCMGEIWQFRRTRPNPMLKQAED